MKEIFDRFKEPSSWAGLTGMLALLLPNLDPGLVTYGVAVLAGLAGLASVFLAEKK